MCDHQEGAETNMGRKNEHFLEAGVSVILVAYNSAHVIEAAIRSIDVKAEIIVVDNASTDDIAAVAARNGARIVRNARNLGFGTACNVGAEIASGAFLLFLNPDARLRPGALGKLVARARTLPGVGALNPRILDEDGRQVQRRHSRLLGEAANARLVRPLSEDSNVEMISGAALLCPAERFHEIGGFDEEIFLFCEDDDLAVRFKKAGYDLAYVHDAVVEHAGGSSSQTSVELDRFKAYHFMRSGLYGRQKHGLAIRRRHQLALCTWKYCLGWLMFDRRQRAKYAGYLTALREPVKIDGKIVQSRG